MPLRSELGAGYMLLSVAEQSIYAGKLTLIKEAAQRALTYFPEDTEGRQRALLYLNIALIFTDGYEKGLAELKGMAGARLRPQDAQIRETVLNLAGQMRQTPAEPGASLAQITASTAKADTGSRAFAPAAIRQKAAGLVGEIDQVLAKAK